MAKKNEVTREMTRMFLRGVAKVVEPFWISYIMPSYYRKYPMKFDVVDSTYNCITYLSLGTVEFFGSLGGMASYLSDKEKNGNAIFLALPLALHLTTNAMSGLYELYLKARKNVLYPVSPANPTPSSAFPITSPSHLPHPSAPSPPAPAHSASPSAEEKSLEEKVEDRSVRNIPNPWDIDIPKIEDKKIVRREYGR